MERTKGTKLSSRNLLNFHQSFIIGYMPVNTLSYNYKSQEGMIYYYINLILFYTSRSEEANFLEVKYYVMNMRIQSERSDSGY